MSGAYLHVFTLKFLALKKLVFSPHKKCFPKFFWLLFTFILCNFSVRTLKYFQKKNWINFLSIKTLKNWPQKLLIIGPDPFISQSSPDRSPQPRINFSYYEISGPDICSLICACSNVVTSAWCSLFMKSLETKMLPMLLIFQ